jgi:hypothetical protein
MLFHSDLFLFEFLPITFMVFLILRRLTPGAVTPGLLAPSLVFYGWEDPFRLLPLIGWSITLNLLIGRYLFCNPKQWGNYVISTPRNLPAQGRCSDTVTCGSPVTILCKIDCNSLFLLCA